MQLIKLILTALLLTLALGRPAAARAQSDDTLELFVRRNVGYSGAGEIQGSFRLEVTAPADVTSVIRPDAPMARRWMRGPSVRIWTAATPVSSVARTRSE